MKKLIGRLVPYPLILAGRKLVHAGEKECVVCGGHVRRFLDSGYGYPVLERLQVVGGMMRPADQCPLCHSGCRERLIWAWLSDFGRRSIPALAATSREPIAVAHFAPEKGLTSRLKDWAGPGYQPFDYDPRRYRHVAGVQQANLMDLKLQPDRFDLLLCNHVIEHVPDPARALAELHRILRPSGVAIVQVPIALALNRTIELGEKSSPQERIEQAGQDDHLRLFSNDDYRSLLADAGFATDAYHAFDAEPKLAAEWELDPLEVLLICRKPAG